MAKQFLTYQKFIDKNDAINLADYLRKNKIEFLLEDHSMPFDPAFAFNELNKEFRIKISKDDFEAVDKIQIEMSGNLIENIDKGHYLYDFTDRELLEVVSKSDEWSKLDFLLAQKILKDRNQELNQNALSTFKKQRIKDLSIPETSHAGWIVVGYLLSLSGILGIFIGWHLLTNKKTLPNGDSVFIYAKGDRWHGKMILIMGIIFAVWFIFKITTIE